MGIAELGDEAEVDADSLLPMLDICSLLKLVSIREGTITLTNLGERVNSRNFSKKIGEELARIEPFKAIIAELRKGKIKGTNKLVAMLEGKGITHYGKDKEGIAELKRMLTQWGVRSKLLAYDPEHDVWSV